MMLLNEPRPIYCRVRNRLYIRRVYLQIGVNFPPPADPVVPAAGHSQTPLTHALRKR